VRRIVKNHEPKTLLEYRLRSGARWEGDNQFAEIKGDIRKALVNEQRGLCCYCMRRIKASAGDMSIEHWASRKDNEPLALNWQNLFGVCPGDVLAPSTVQHCDRSQADKPITISPLNDRHMNSITYTANGKVISKEPELDRDLNERLNLNIPNLRSARKKALQGFLDAFARKNWNKQFIDQLLKRPPGPLPEYWGVIESRLKKRQQRG
jgi:uncharacterized protein (TIGR02646 family)